MRFPALFTLLAVTAPMFSQALVSSSIASPTGDHSLQPNWSTTPDGGVVLSWIEPAKSGTFSLRYAVRHGSSWSEARTVVVNRHFFRHPAEAPEVLELAEHQWMAHWVEMPSESSEAEYLYVSSSTDGLKWTEPAIAHRDRSPVEHGLVSMIGTGNGEASLFWLTTPKGEDGPAYLMRTIVNGAGKEIKEERLDSDVCSCCPTAVAKTTAGLIVAYRDHTPQDVRDIAVLRFEKGAWLPSKIIHADNWKLNACPINAAAIAAKDNHVAIAWFTGADNSPKVQIVFSEDGGATFGKPVLLSTGHANGYTSIVLDRDGGAVVSWLEKSAGQSGDTRVLVRKVSSAAAPGPVLEVAKGGEGLGYPRLGHSQDGIFIAWGGAKVQTAQLANR
jgi:hypothetical protein